MNTLPLWISISFLLLTSNASALGCKYINTVKSINASNLQLVDVGYGVFIADDDCVGLAIEGSIGIAGASLNINVQQNELWGFLGYEIGASYLKLWHKEDREYVGLIVGARILANINVGLYKPADRLDDKEVLMISIGLKGFSR